MSSDESDLTPESIELEALDIVNNLLPEKSKEKYLKAYDDFDKWKTARRAKSVSESVLLVYFKYLSCTKKSSSLWCIYSMLRLTISLKHDIKINTYTKLLAFLRRTSVGHQAKKSKVLTAQDVETFLNEAPDHSFLAMKVALIFGVNGACRGNELVNMKVNNIEKHEELLLINLRDTKTNSERSFIIREEYARIVEKYQALRPSNINTNRFFIGYSNGKCTRHVIGKNKISAMPKEIAKYLNLPNPELYTGYCFRRTSASLLADSGADMAQIKCHGGWKSEAVAEVYIENPIENNISCGIDDNIDLKTPYIISDPWKPLPPQPSTSKYILSSPLLEAPPSPTFKMEPNDPQTQGSDVFTAAQINSISTNISIPEQKCNYIFT